MAKQKKKRTKAYRGADARQTRPTIQRISAENRGPVREWWVSHRHLARPLAIVSGALAAIALLISGIISLVSL